MQFTGATSGGAPDAARHGPGRRHRRGSIAFPAPSAERVLPDAPGKLNPRWARDTVRVYVPNSLRTARSPRLTRVPTGSPARSPWERDPTTSRPSWDGSVLWVNNTDGQQPDPIDPRTGEPARPVPVADPYNLYFTPDGQHALVMAEALNRIDFRDPRTMRLRYSMDVPARASTTWISPLTGTMPLPAASSAGRSSGLTCARGQCSGNSRSAWPWALRARPRRGRGTACRKMCACPPTARSSTSPTWPRAASG